MSTFPDLFIMQVPTLSTSHITCDDGAMLADPRNPEVLAEITGGTGHIIHFEPDTLDEEFSHYSAPFRSILSQLAAAGFRYVRFDSDHDVYPSFPTFDW
jgi:hypothetical protein